jgi:choline monooxygenase
MYFICEGDYITGDIAGRHPYIIVRGDDDQIRCFFNVCRHHANILLTTSSGHDLHEIQCCYHGWTYALDGKLIKATKLKGIKDFKPKDFGLHEVPLCVWGPFLFIHMGPVGVKKDSMRPEEVCFF